METQKRITFYSEHTPIKEAKRKASLHFNNEAKLSNHKPVNEFNYVTTNGTYVFFRRNRIYPSGFVILGTWK